MNQIINRLTKTLCLVLLLSCIQVGTTNAQSRYVATNGSNSKGTGSQALPWATITYAIDQVTDGTTIEVAPGTYNGRVTLDQHFQTGVVVRSSVPYQARLRHNSGAALICFTCQGITVEGFDIAHSANNNGALVIQIQTSQARNVTLRNNIIHDSTDNDLLKVNNGTRDITIKGNIFYNQAGSDEHIDINSVENIKVSDNIFFNSKSQAVTSSYIVVKDSNGNNDGVLGSKNISIRRNIFLNWQGNDGQSFVRVGEDGTSNFEASDVLIENNLMLGNSNRLMRSALTIQGSNDIRFQFNTVVGDLPSRSFAARLLATGSNKPNDNIVLSNNICSDPNGSMGGEGFIGADVFDAPNGDNTSVSLQNNLYYNGGNAIPSDTSQEVNIGSDTNPILGNPLLPSLIGLTLPVYNGSMFGGGFGGGFVNIRSVFVDLANRYGRPASGSPAINAANMINVPSDDLLGTARGANAYIGAIDNTSASPPPTPNVNAVLSWLILLLD